MAELPYDVTSVRSARPPRAHPAPDRPPNAPAPIELEGLGFAGEVIEALLPWTEADSAALLLDFLTCFGSAVGPGPHMYAGGARHEARLYSVAVGKTSAGRKGTARATVSRLYELAEPDWSKDNVQGGLSSGEGLIQAMADMEGTKNFLAVETEFGKVLAVASRMGNTVSDQVRQLWEGDRVRVLNRKQIKLDGAFFSLLGHVTDTELRDRMSNVDLVNGFANRILWVYTQRSKLLPDGGRLPDELIDPVARDVGKAIRRARRVGEVERTKRASNLWRQHYLEMAESRLGGQVAAITDRREAQCARLSLVFALLDGGRQIRPEHVNAAYTVWRYCEETAVLVFGNSTGDAHADRVLLALKRADRNGMKRSEIRKKVLADNVSGAKLDAIRERLEDAELIEVEKGVKTGGRSAELWRYIG